MKRLVFVVTVALLAIAILSVGCSAKETPKPAAKPPVTGILTDVNTPVEGGQATVKVNDQLVTVMPDTVLAFNGQFCTLDDLEKKLAAATAANTSYNCTIVYDDMLGALAVYVAGP